MSTNPQPIDSKFCAFCGPQHPAHVGKRCTLCNCKGKKKTGSFWKQLGNQLGEALFGGNR